jgi:hypothetical protein
MDDLNSQQLFNFLSKKLNGWEHILFKWEGGGDDWTGFQFVFGVKAFTDVRVTKIPAELDANTITTINNSAIVHEMNCFIGAADEFSSEGYLLVALKPLSKPFKLIVKDQVASKIILQQDMGFKGFAISGKNYESQYDEELGGADYAKVTKINGRLYI